MEDAARIKMLEDYCYCPSYLETRQHGQHPKCRKCRYSQAAQ